MNMDNNYYHGYVLMVLFTDGVRANSTSTDSSSSDTNGLKIAISCGVIIFALVSALLIAKLFNMWLSRRADTSDDGSDISDNTRDLIRARLAVIQYKKRQLDKSKKPNIKDFFLHWSETVKNRKKLRKSKSTSKENNIVLNTEDIVEVKENGTARSPRLPIFSGGTSQNSPQKHSKDSVSVRKSANQRTVHVSSAASNATSIVAKGRPVSSRPHILSSSSQTNTSALFKEQKQTNISAPPIPQTTSEPLIEQQQTSKSAPPTEQKETNTPAPPTEQKQTNTPAPPMEQKQTIKTVQPENATEIPRPPDISS